MHCIGTGHCVLFEDITVLSEAYRFWDRVIGKSIEIVLKSNALNRNTGLQLGTSWKHGPRKIGLFLIGANWKFLVWTIFGSGLVLCAMYPVI